MSSLTSGLAAVALHRLSVPRTRHIIGACNLRRAIRMSDTSPLICIHIANLPMPTRNNYRRSTWGFSLDAGGATSTWRRGLDGPLWYKVPSDLAAAINPPTAGLPCPRELRAPKKCFIAINCWLIVGSVGREEGYGSIYVVHEMLILNIPVAGNGRTGRDLDCKETRQYKQWLVLWIVGVPIWRRWCAYFREWEHVLFTIHLVLAKYVRACSMGWIAWSCGGNLGEVVCHINQP